MNANILDIVSIVAFSLAVVFAIVSIILFFKLNIRAIIDDLSGKKAERQIKEYRQQAISARKKVNMHSDHQDYYNLVTTGFNESTAKLQVNQLAIDADDTILLNDEGTMLLDDDSTMLLNNEEHMEEYCLMVDELIIHTGEKI